jgi:hypothetical protein
MGQSDEVFLAFGQYQIEKGNFEGALNTAEQAKSGYQLFYDIGNALRIRGEQSRARKLAARMKDRKLAALFELRAIDPFVPRGRGQDDSIDTL